MVIGTIVKFVRSSGAVMTGMILSTTSKTVVLKVDGCRWHVPIEEVSVVD